MSRLLRRKFDPVEVETLRETEALLAARPEVALVICDLSLGDGSAIALQRWLAQHRPDLAERLVVITGGASTDEARQFLHQIGERAVSKPPDIEQMLALVERLTA
jgi:DNA-binding NtrC family response regulator